MLLEVEALDLKLATEVGFNVIVTIFEVAEAIDELHVMELNLG